jgi:hypothetical protein
MYRAVDLSSRSRIFLKPDLVLQSLEERKLSKISAASPDPIFRGWLPRGIRFFRMALPATSDGHTAGSVHFSLKASCCPSRHRRQSRTIRPSRSLLVATYISAITKTGNHSARIRTSQRIPDMPHCFRLEFRGLGIFVFIE